VKKDKIPQRAKHSLRPNKNKKKRSKKKRKKLLETKKVTNVQELQGQVPPPPPPPPHLLLEKKQHFAQANQMDIEKEEGSLQSFEPPRPPTLPAIIQQQQQQQPFPVSLSNLPPPPPPSVSIPSMDSHSLQRPSPPSLPPPSNILLASNLPDEITHEILVNDFQKYHGFVEVRSLLSKKLAFIEYVDEIEAGAALRQEKKRVGYMLTYAKK